MRTILCIPTFNSEKKLKSLLPVIKAQTLQPDEFWVIDSSSTDKTVQLLQDYGANVHSIPQSEFNHGGTRNLFLSVATGDIYLYLTDDAIPATPTTFESLIGVFGQDLLAGIVYGRQLPHQNATPFAAHARLFNYPETSLRKTFEDRKKLGIKTPFNSDSFAAYRATALEEVGRFPNHVIVAEDAYLAAKMLQKGWAVHYVAEAQVCHSHNYSILQEFKRYFDIGVFHGNEKWIREVFGNAEREGSKFLSSEWNYLSKNRGKRFYPEWFLRNLMKWVGYRLGIKERFIPRQIKKLLSMHRGYWSAERITANMPLSSKTQPGKS